MCLGQRYCGRVHRRGELFSCRDENGEQNMEKGALRSLGLRAVDTYNTIVYWKTYWSYTL